jgi:DNA repair protein RadA/Sms
MSSNIGVIHLPFQEPEAQVNRNQDGKGIAVSGSMGWFVNRLGGSIPRGANILLSGDPGVGKSTLALQIGAAVAGSGQKVLYLATEQTGGAVMARLGQLSGHTRVLHYLTVKDDIYDLALLPQLLTHQLLRPGADLYGTALVVVDSLQGCGGVSAQDRRVWGAVLDYLRQASSAGIASLALAHMTKGNSIAGPRTLEHACDVTMLLRHGASCRAMMVPKNRLGPSQMEPYALAIDAETTRLEPSPLGVAATAIAKSIGPGGIVEIQVAITPVRSERGFIKSPGLSRTEVETVVDLVERSCPEARYLWANGVTVRAPDGIPHRRDYNLAIAAALLGALRRKPVPQDAVYIGDLGLRGEVRPPSVHALGCLEDAHAAGAIDGIRIVVATPWEQSLTGEIPLPLRTITGLNDLLGLEIQI